MTSQSRARSNDDDTCSTLSLSLRLVNGELISYMICRLLKEYPEQAKELEARMDAGSEVLRIDTASHIRYQQLHAWVEFTDSVYNDFPMLRVIRTEYGRVR